jgi:hypothetical protein
MKRLDNDPRPLEWGELRDPALWIGAVMVLIALGAMFVFMVATVPGPK